MPDITKNEQIQYPIGIDDAFIVLVKDKGTSTTPPVYDDMIWRLSIISKLKVKGNGKATEKWASNKLFARVSRTTQHELGLDHVGMPVELADALSGKNAKHGVSFGKTTPIEMPEFGFGYIAPQSDGVNNGFWYPRVSLDPATELDYETVSDGDLTIPDTSITMIASGLQVNSVLWADYNSARSTATDLTLDQFMKQVVYDEKQLEGLVTPTSNKGAVE